MRAVNCTIVIIAIVLINACAPKKVRQSPISEIRGISLPDPKKIKSEAWRLFFRAEKAFALKKYDEALSLYSQAKEKSKSRANMVSSYRIGTILYYQERYSEASREFTYYLRTFPNSDLTFDVTYNLAASEFQQENYASASRTLSRLSVASIQNQGPDRAELVYRLAALSAASMSNHPLAISYYSAQIQLPISESKRQNLRDKIDWHLGQIEQRKSLESLLSYVSEPITRSKIVERLDTIAMKKTAVAIPSPAPSSLPSYGSAPKQPTPIKFRVGDSGVSPRRSHIGVVLPLTGRFAAYGKRALDSVLLAAQVYEKDRDWNLNIFIRDSRSNPITAANAVDDLVFKHNVFAIIGPTSWKESLAVGRRAQELGVVNLSLTVREGLSVRGPQLFQNGLTAKVQMENLVRHCFEEKKFSRYAILAPNDSFGREMTEQFWDIVESYGGKIVGHVVYPPNQTDFQSYVRELTGLNNTKTFRKVEVEALNKYLEEQRAEGVRNPKASLPPIANFDALFIPDTPKAIGQIAPSLAYFDVDGYPLLGTAEWNTEQLYKRAGRYVEGAIFPGGLNTASSNNKQRDFIRKYRNAFGKSPDLLSAQAFEATEILAAAISRVSDTRYSKLSQMLNRVVNFSSPLGKVSFDETRVARRRLPIYSIEYGGKITEQ